MKKFIIFFFIIITSCEREAEIVTYFSINNFSFYDLEGQLMKVLRLQQFQTVG